MNKYATPFRVGLLAIGSIALLGFFLAFVRKGGLSKDESLAVHAYFRDASGLSKKSRVQVAGIPVGEIEDIVLEGSRAKITLRIQKSAGLHTDAALRKRSESLLGDYLLDVSPGSETAPLMADGGAITRVQDQQGMEAIFESLGRITSDIEQVTTALRRVLGGDKGTNSLDQIVDNLVRLSSGVDKMVTDSSEKLSTILNNFQGVSGDIRAITGENQRSINEIVENIRLISHDTEAVVSTVRRIVSGGEPDMSDSVANLKQVLERVDRTLANIEQVTTQIKDGKGALGTLLSDERIGQKVSETVEDVSDFASRLTRLKLEVGVRSEYLMAQGATKNSVGIRIIPKPDKYYLIDLVNDPRGVVETDIIQSNPPATGQPVTQVQRITRDRLKISAQFAKRYYFLTLRFGLIESTGGIGGDIHFLNDAVSLKLDAFDFSVQHLNYPRLRATLRIQALGHLFMTAGIDDMLNTQVRDAFTNRLVAGRDFFFGGGVFFTDDDLKAVLTAIPAPAP